MAKPPPIGPDESASSYVVRIARWTGWQEAHDMFCDFGDGRHPDDDQHSNPYDKRKRG